MTPLTADLLIKAGIAAQFANRYALILTALLPVYRVDSRERLTHFLAQISHESIGFSRTVENLNYKPQALLDTWPSRFTPALANQLGRTAGHKADQVAIANVAYGGRYGNAPNQGYLYRGRGLMQITFKDNYGGFSRWSGVDYVANPQLLERPQDAAVAAFWYWSDRSINQICDKNISTDVKLRQVTAQINAGLKGLDDRKDWLTRYQRLI